MAFSPSRFASPSAKRKKAEPTPPRWQSGSTAMRWITTAGRAVVQGSGSYSGDSAVLIQATPASLPSTRAAYSSPRSRSPA